MSNTIQNTARLRLAVFAGFLFFTFSFLFSPSTASAALTQGLVRHWTFDGKNMIRNVADIGATTTPLNLFVPSGKATSTLLTSGKLGQGFKGDGTSTGYVSSTSVPLSWSTATNYSVCLWMNATSPSTIGSGSKHQTMFSSLLDSANIMNISMGYGVNAGKIYATLNFGGGSGSISSDLSLIATSTWTHICVTGTGTTGNIWKNATLAAKSFDSSVIQTTASGASIRTVISGLGGSYNSNEGAFTGKIDDVRVYDRVLSASEIQQLYKQAGGTKLGVTPTRTASSTATGLARGLVGHWTFDGKDTPWTSSTSATTIDKSGNGNTGTLTNMNRSTSTGQGKIGQGLKFDGSDDFVDMGSASSLDTGVGAISASAWIFPRSLGESSRGRIFDKSNGGSNGWNLLLSTNSGTNQIMYANGGLYQETVSNVVSLNKWQHIVVTWGGGSVSDARIYVNGVETGYAASTNGAPGSGDDHSLYIGNNVTLDRAFDGYIDDARIYNRVLTVSEVKQLYKQGATKLGVTPIVASSTKGINSGLVGHWTFDGKDTIWTSATAATTLDKSGNGLTATLTSMNRSTSTVPGKSGQALRFDGSNDYLRTSSNALLDLETARTVSLWMNVRDHSGTYAQLVAGGSLSCCGTEWYIAHDNQYSTNKIDVKHTGVTQQTSTKTISPNKWYYVTWTYDGTTSRLYIDGTLESSTAMTGPVSEFSNDVHIGAGEGPSSLFPGTLDDVRIYNRALSATEIKQLYSLGQTKFR